MTKRVATLKQSRRTLPWTNSDTLNVAMVSLLFGVVLFYACRSPKKRKKRSKRFVPYHRRNRHFTFTNFLLRAMLFLGRKGPDVGTPLMLIVLVPGCSASMETDLASMVSLTEGISPKHASWTNSTAACLWNGVTYGGRCGR